MADELKLILSEPNDNVKIEKLKDFIFTLSWFVSLSNDEWDLLEEAKNELRKLQGTGYVPLRRVNG